MIVYVETNFVLDIALEQDQFQCDRRYAKSFSKNFKMFSE